MTWWLEGSNLTGQVSSGPNSMSVTKDFTKPSDEMRRTYEWSTSFVFLDAKWIVSPGSPPQAMTAPPLSAHLAAPDLGSKAPVELQLDHANWLITFVTPIAAAALGLVASELLKRLGANFKQLQVNIVGNDGTRIRLVYQAGSDANPGTVAFLGIPMGVKGPTDTIETCLTELKSDNIIPSNEQWTIAPGTDALSLATTANSESEPSSGETAAK